MWWEQRRYLTYWVHNVDCLGSGRKPHWCCWVEEWATYRHGTLPHSMDWPSLDLNACDGSICDLLMCMISSLYFRNIYLWCSTKFLSSQQHAAQSIWRYDWLRSVLLAPQKFGRTSQILKLKTDLGLQRKKLTNLATLYWTETVKLGGRPIRWNLSWFIWIAHGICFTAGLIQSTSRKWLYVE